MGMRVIVAQLEMFEPEIKEIRHGGVQVHVGQGAGLTRELFPGLFQVIAVQMEVAERMDEFPRTEVGHPGDHEGQQGIAGNIERHSEKSVRRSLVELTREPSFGDIKLEQAMTRAERHLVEVAYIPGGYHHPPGIRLVANGVQEFGYLIMCPAIRTLPGSPLVSVYRTQIALFIGPFVPYPHPVVLEVPHVRISLQKPEQLIYDGTEMQFFGGDEREAFFQVEAHLVAEYT